VLLGSVGAAIATLDAMPVDRSDRLAEQRRD
jgi:hypothetical protein